MRISIIIGSPGRRCAAAIIALSLAGTAGPTFGQSASGPLDIADIGRGLPKGSLVFHGNYCGPGDRGAGLAPVDALDAACMHHDACSPALGHGLPSCECNERLHREASVVAEDPRTSDDLRAAADFVALGAGVLRCHR